MQKVTKANFESLVLASGKTALVKFGAKWCQPCKVLAPVLEKLAKNNPDLVVVEVDIDEEEELTQEFGIRGVPTVVVVKNRKQHSKHIGVTNEATLLDMLK